MKSAIRLTAILTALLLVLSGCADTTVTVEPSASPVPEIASYSGLEVNIIPAPADAEFGLIEDYYTAEGSTTVTLGEVGGDVAVLNPIGFRVTTDSLAVNSVDVLFDAEFPVAFTAKKYTNGEVTDDGGILGLESGGIVEKYNADGTWSRAEFAELRTPGEYEEPSGIKMTLEKDDFPTLKDGAVSMALPFENPGVYRYTLYFRECIDESAENRTTGEEMYTLSVIFDIPKSDKLFDVVAVSALEAGEIFDGAHKGEQGYTPSVLIRTNTEDRQEAFNNDPVYSLNHGGTLERRDGYGWVEIENGLFSFEDEAHWVSGGPAEFENAFLNTSDLINTYFPELKGEYRLRATFVYGDRELIELPLNFNFGE